MEFKDSKAIYIQIAERLCDEIQQEMYLEDDRIPSAREYAMIVEVNYNTVKRSFEYLQKSDIIYNKRGIGFFVSPNARNKIINLRKEIFLEEEIPDFFQKAKMLNIPISDIIERFEQIDKEV